MTARNSVPLRGRDAELARIKRRLQEVAAGVGAVIVIEGRAGLGKTRLLEECAALAADSHFGLARALQNRGVAWSSWKHS
jgi:predicted ATPase